MKTVEMQVVEALPRKPLKGRRKKIKSKGVTASSSSSSTLGGYVHVAREQWEDQIDLEVTRDRWRNRSSATPPESRMGSVRPNAPLPDPLVRYQLMKGGGNAASVDLTMALLADIRAMAP